MRTAAVIGCGDISVVHLEAIDALDDVRLVAVADVDVERAAAAGSRWNVPTFADHRTLLAEARPDVVHVCTPHDQHAPVVTDCLEAGVAVLTEKPLAESVAAAERVVTVADAHPDVKIGVCFQNRYNATVETIRERLLGGAAGEVIGGSATVLWHRTPEYYASRPWRGQWEHSGGGVMINQAIHTLDLLQWLLGDVVAVEASIRPSRLAGVEVEDTALLHLEHAGGARSVFVATNANVVDSPVTLEIDAERARFFVRGDLTVRASDGTVESVAERRVTSAGRDYWGVSHQRLIADFYARLDDADPFWIGPREALASLRIIDQAYRAAGLR